MTDPMGTDPPVVYSAQQMSKLREAIQEGLRQAAQQRAYARAYSGGNFEGGTSFIGMANFHMAQVETARTASPQVNISKAGNWGDRDSPDYYVDGPLSANGRPTEGVTQTSLTELRPHDDGSVTGILTVNTHVLKMHKGDRVDQLEQQHPQAWRDWHHGLSDRAFWKFKDASFASPLQAGQAKANYIQNLYKEEFRRQSIWDMPGGPHDY